jgi:hypothetical protein
VVLQDEHWSRSRAGISAVTEKRSRWPHPGQVTAKVVVGWAEWRWSMSCRLARGGPLRKASGRPLSPGLLEIWLHLT